MTPPLQQIDWSDILTMVQFKVCSLALAAYWKCYTNLVHALHYRDHGTHSEDVQCGWKWQEPAI